MAGLSGCASAVHRRSAKFLPESFLVFNPAESEIPLQDYPRSDWPSVIAPNQPVEFITFQEFIIDDQGRYFGRSDNYRRRFESVRIGRSVR